MWQQYVTEYAQVQKDGSLDLKRILAAIEVPHIFIIT
jgi:hypothetical protein